MPPVVLVTPLNNFPKSFPSPLNGIVIAFVTVLLTEVAAFLSVSCWLNEDERYTNDLILVFKELIKQRIKGIRQEDGTYLNPNFPKILYFLDEDTMKGGKYYDITRMCAECSSKRLVPDYLSVRKHKELKGVPTPPMGK